MGKQGPGDPLTPGFPSVDGIYRNPINKSGLPTIPAVAMSYGDAKEILRRMKGKNCTFPEVNVHKARFKRRILDVPNLMQMRKIYCFRLFALDSAHLKCDV